MAFVQGFAPLQQWDGLACEAACAAQLLHAAGKLGIPFDTAHFDRLVGRTPGQYDVGMGCAKLLMRNGFVETTIDPEATVDGLDREKTRARLRREGIEPAAIEHYMRELFPLQATRARAALEFERRYARQLHHLRRRPTMDDLTAALRRGEIAQLTTTISKGTAHVRLMRGVPGKATVEFYDPAGGSVWPFPHLRAVPPIDMTRTSLALYAVR